ncbi:DEAD/DEAH box helicase [Acinetobacter baumannii]|nr:DEAD/DEAH box helicase [Acinetobacter baumannii]
MNHWLLDSIQEHRTSALNLADKLQLNKEILFTNIDVDFQYIEQTASSLELAVLDLMLSPFEVDEDKERLLKKTAQDAFKLYRALHIPFDAQSAGIHLLRTATLGVIADRSADTARWLRSLDNENGWPKLEFESSNWGKRTWATIIDIWLRLIRKKGWDDRDVILERVSNLRTSQENFEKKYLENIDKASVKAAALELIALYHLSKAADIFAQFMTDGVVEGNYQIQYLLDMHFDRALQACEPAQLIELEPLIRLLTIAATQMVNNSIWTVTRAVNSRVTKFVKSLVDRGRGEKAIFDVLPPQRRTLAEKGLLGSSRRAVVVSLPTSSGKTLIAQFRILQALNQFDDQEGWVAYIAPTRALVNQVTRQLRKDFNPLNIVVEQLSPALEFDNIEIDLLQENQQDAKFRVLVTTPEKLDLMLKQGWEEKIGRPLTLVVVDEAHNINSDHRGLKLELLLATINNESKYAQFLLLTPFINNAKEVARWLGGSNSEDVSLGLDWQPNDRVIGVIKPIKGKPLSRKSFDYSLDFEMLHTSRDTLALDESFTFPSNHKVANSYSKAGDQGHIAAMAASYLKKRGPVIVMHSTPGYVWSLAKKIKKAEVKSNSVHEDILLVQKYLILELGKDFPLIDLLEYGIGVHHSGLPEEVRQLIEWLFENERLSYLVATTTIAQGINFPVSGVVLASHQYPSKNKAPEDMPPEDFWNIAGRAGRVSQGQLGVIALAAKDNERANVLKSFIHKNTGDLNSALIQMAITANNELTDLGRIVYKYPEWSSFLQYLAHTYRQMDKPEGFIDQIEQVLRGTLGFEKLRLANSNIARQLLQGIRNYTDTYLSDPRAPLKLVDSTGFSIQGIRSVFTHKGDINKNSWNPETLFSEQSPVLKDMMGVLLHVPELRDNFKDVIGQSYEETDKLASIIKDWVNGKSIPEIAEKHFSKVNEEFVDSITRCGQKLFGKVTQTTSWGLGALLAITASDLPEDELKKLSNLPSQVFYGVNSDEAIVMRLLGIPRTAAKPLADYCKTDIKESLPSLRNRLKNLTDTDWNQALGENGQIYRKVWHILEGN